MNDVNHMTPSKTIGIMEEFSEVFTKKSYIDNAQARMLLQVQLATSEIGSHELDSYLSEYVMREGQNAIKNSEVYYCAPEMSELIEHAAKVMDSSDKADAGIFPSKNGFCYFDKGIVFNDYITIHGLYWFKIEPEGWAQTGLPDMWAVLAFNDAYRGADELSNLYRSFRCGRWSFSYMTMLKEGLPVVTDKQITSEETAKLIESGHARYIDTNLEAYIHALFLLMQQERVVDRSERVSSPNRKKVARLKKEGKPSDVVVVRLRKARYVGDGESRESGIEYSVRWFVSGHWRWQPYKNENGVEDYKRIFISPYIKGPEDKPLKISKRVVAIVK